MALLRSKAQSQAIALGVLAATVAVSALSIHASLSTKRYGEDVSYSPSAAILICELVRLAIFLAIGFSNTALKARNASLGDRLSHLSNQVFGTDVLHTMLPALFFAAQTFLQYTALDALDACTFLGALQFRMLIASVVSTTISQAPVNMHRVALMILMTVGIVFMVASQFPDSPASSDSPPVAVGMRFPGAGAARLKGSKNIAGGPADNQKRGMEDEPTVKSNPADFAVNKVVLGMLVSLATGMFSGIGSAMVENIHDSHSVTQQGLITGGVRSDAWVLNVRVSLLTILGALAALGTVSKDIVAEHGLLYGFNNSAWVAILVQAGGGAAAAALYENVGGDVESKSALGAILTAFGGAVVMGDLDVSLPYVLGVFLVSAALWSMSRQPKHPSQSSTGPVSYGLPS